MPKLLVTLLLGSSFLFPIASYAEGTYLKVGVGEWLYSEDQARSPTSSLIAIGTSIASGFSGEVGYVNFGSASTKLDLGGGVQLVDRIKNRSIYAAGIGDVPLSSSVSFQGKLGIAMHVTNTHINIKFPGLFSFSEDSTFRKTQALVGAGFKFQFSKEISGVVDYTHFGAAVDGSQLSLFSAGLLYHF
jgi:hypothetical protein